MEVQVIPPKSKRESSHGTQRKIRVAGYARVSSLPQEESYESQVKHIHEVIESNPDWEFAGVYGDSGVSGMNTKHRDGFNQLVRDAKKGKIDILLVKSISRWGRNIVDSLSTIRQLRACGIDIYFEKENMHTLNDPASEFMLSIMAAFAENESMSISANVKMGLTYKMQRGEWHAPFERFLGYSKKEDGEVVVVPEQAETVKEIFNLFLSGMTIGDISRQLEAEGRLTGAGNSIWYYESLRTILKNMKYTGDVLIQLTYMKDVLGKKRAVNNGDVPQYFVRNAIPPIIDHQTYFLAQGELMRREMKDAQGPKVYRVEQEFTKLITCPYCGANYNRATSGKTIRWGCYNRFHKNTCLAPWFTEAALQRTLLRAVQELHRDQPKLNILPVETLCKDDSDDKKVEAAAAFMHNTFADRVQKMLDAPMPEHYDRNLTSLVERMGFTEKEWIIHFYGDVSVKIPSETENSETPRRLHRVTHPNPMKGSKRGTERRRR